MKLVITPRGVGKKKRIVDLGSFLSWSMQGWGLADCTSAWVIGTQCLAPFRYILSSPLRTILTHQPWPLVSPQALKPTLFFSRIQPFHSHPLPGHPFNWRPESQIIVCLKAGQAERPQSLAAISPACLGLAVTFHPASGHQEWVSQSCWAKGVVHDGV